MIMNHLKISIHIFKPKLPSIKIILESITNFDKNCIS